MTNKSIIVGAVEYAMLLEIAKRNRQKPDQCLKSLIQNAYSNRK